MTDMKHVWAVTHQAFKTEYVIAESRADAQNAASNGFDTGDYVYGETDHSAEPLGEVTDLLELPGIGRITVDKLLNAESAIGLGPAARPESISKADRTRLQNRLTEHSPKLGRFGIRDVKRNIRDTRGDRDV